MSKILDIISTLRRDVMAKEPLSYQEPQQIFNFDVAPKSIADNAFRIENRGWKKKGEASGGIIYRESFLEIWISRKLKPGKTDSGETITRMDRYHNDSCEIPDEIEKEIYAAFPSLEINVEEAESKEVENDFFVMVMRLKVQYEVRL